MSLEPDVVAEFLEQLDLDPVTGAAGAGGDVAAELVRASVDRAAAQLVQEEAAETRRRREQATDGASAESGRLRHTSSPSPFADHEWDPTEASSFAITTVNVPDRLDLQEERDRAEMEEYAEHRRRVVLQAWMKRFLVVAVVIVFGGVVYGVLKPVRDQASASRVGERLTGAFKVPVKVAGTEFRFLPSPRLILRGVDVGGEFGADQVALLINWKDLWFALNGGQWVWARRPSLPPRCRPPRRSPPSSGFPAERQDCRRRFQRSASSRSRCQAPACSRGGTRRPCDAATTGASVHWS